MITSIAGRDPGKKVLVLSDNKTLATSLAARLDEPGLRGVEVRHFHSWMARNTRLRWRREEESFDSHRSYAVMEGCTLGWLYTHEQHCE